MIRLLWLSAERVDPEDAFEALAGMRPAPEPFEFAEATPELLQHSLAKVVIVDGRGGRADAAAAVTRKLNHETEADFLVVLDEEGLGSFDWSCGAADFVTAQVGRRELEARIARLSAPSEPEPADLVKRGDIAINRDRFEVRVRGDLVDLTYKEFELLWYLASRPGKVCSRSALLREVWGYDFFGGTRTVDVHIRRLRAKLGGEAAAQIETVRNVGYRLAG
jgi:DNA-binding response OmpR family regulator